MDSESTIVSETSAQIGVDDNSDRAKKRQYDRQNQEAAQVRGHNKRVRDRYPEIWAQSTITNEELLAWVLREKPKGCSYCGQKAREIDHKTPLSRDGKHEFQNLQMLCEPCNRSKRDMTDEEFRPIVTKSVEKKHGLSLADYGLSKDDLKDVKYRPRTKSLFLETWFDTDRAYPCYFSLVKDEDSPEGLISVKRVYLALADPTEYKIANALFCGVNHWRRMCASDWFLDHVKKWRKELKAKIRSDVTEKILAIADSGGQGALQALKTLATEEFIYKSFLDEEEPREKKPRGRPKKEEIEETIPDNILNDDLARISVTE